MSSTVSIQAHAGQFLRVGDDRRVAATAPSSSDAETFVRVDLGGRKVALQSAKGAYVGLDLKSGGLFADRAAVGPDETFTLEDGPAGKQALRASNGKYVCAEGGGGGLVQWGRGDDLDRPLVS